MEEFQIVILSGVFYWENEKGAGMKVKGKRFLAALVACVLVSACLVQGVFAAVENGTVFEIESNGWEDWPQADALAAETAVLMDADSGAILVDKGMTEARYPASITKVVTALVAIENSKLSDEVVFTEEGLARMAEGTNIECQVGEVMTMRQCLNVMLMVSANEVASQVAIHVAGSEAAFAEMMNEKVEELGGVNSHFTNASGLPDPDHYTCAYDMALVMQAALQNEKFVKIINKENYTLKPTNVHPDSRVYNTHVPLMSEAAPEYYEYCIGGKTGYTNDALNTMLTAARKDDRTLIVVEMRANTLVELCADTTALFNYGFDNFTDIDVDGGRVCVPDGVSLDDLEVSQEETDDAVIYTYYSKEIPVGTAVVDKTQQEAVEEEVTPDETAYTQEEESTPQVDNPLLEHKGFAALTGALCGLIVLGIILIIINLCSRRKKN